MNYLEISKESVSLLYKTYESLKKSPMKAELRVLIELRVSLVNGCEYCIKMHSNEAKSLGISDEKISDLFNWKDSTHYAEKERSALMWADELTSLKINMETKETLKEFFSEREIVDITMTASTMNALNRLAISLRNF